MCVWVGVEWNVSYLENSGEAKEGGSTVDDDAPPEAGGFVAHVLVDNVPGNVLVEWVWCISVSVKKLLLVVSP